jgi:hypothetical protein
MRCLSLVDWPVYALNWTLPPAALPRNSKNRRPCRTSAPESALFLGWQSLVDQIPVLALSSPDRLLGLEQRGIIKGRRMERLKLRIPATS